MALRFKVCCEVFIIAMSGAAEFALGLTEVVLVVVLTLPCSGHHVLHVENPFQPHYTANDKESVKREKCHLDVYQQSAEAQRNLPSRRETALLKRRASLGQVADVGSELVVGTHVLLVRFPTGPRRRIPAWRQEEGLTDVDIRRRLRGT